MKNTGSLFGALLFGAAVGSVISVLFAPDKGAETRKKLMDGAKDMADNLKENIKEKVPALKAMVEEAEDKKDFYKNVHSTSNKATGLA